MKTILKRVKNVLSIDSPRLIPAWFFIICFSLSLGLGLFKGDFRWDEGGYYAYLPAAIIYQDFSFDFSEEASRYPSSEYISRHSKINKYGLGVAILQSPWFVLASVHTLVKGDKLTGYGRTFKKYMGLGSLFYASLGLYFLGLVLRNDFSPQVTNYTLASIGLATNVFYYTVIDNLLSHIFSFFLFSLAMYLGVLWKRNFGKKYFLLLCLVIGLISAVRLTNIIFALVPFLWGVKNFRDFRQLVVQIFSSIPHLLLGIVFFLGPMLPQFIYVYSQLGSIMSPYGAEPFFWQDPLMGKVLWSYRAGWLVWSPIMLFAFIGWVWSRKHHGFLGITLFMIINLYVISSWWCWWYGGGFGMRALVESSAPMSIGLALFFQHALNGNFKWFRWIIYFLVTLNLFQSDQYRKGIIHFDAMTKKAYWTVFGRTAPLTKEREAKRNRELHITNAKKTMTDRAYRKSL